MIISLLGREATPVLAFLQAEAAQQSTSLVDLILRASPIAKFVLVLLLAFSVFSWAIMFAKSRLINRAVRQSREFLRVFERSSRLDELYVATAAFRESPLAAIYVSAHDELKATHGNLEAVTRACQSTAIGETTRLEQSLGWLASTASASPFIGLFGTVVGIIIAFQSLSQSAVASIQAVAPGIADALVATAAGIAAAVPAVLGYNHYLNRIKVLASEMDSFTLRLLNFIERDGTGLSTLSTRSTSELPVGKGD